MAEANLLQFPRAPVVSARPRGRSYEELDGGKGRGVFFRPTRYRPADLGPMQPVAAVVHGGVSRDCVLFDVSQNGAAFECPDELRLEVGEAIQELVVRFDQHEAYRGGARVGSVRRHQDRTIVGASFVDSLMCIEDVLQLRDVKTWSAKGARGLGLAGRAWHVPQHERFKSLVAELRLFFEDAAAQMAEMEGTLPWHVLHGESESPARGALVERIGEEFVAEVVRSSAEIDQALRTATPSESQGLKEFSIREVHGFLMQSPWMHRAFHKPLGYPGDFEIMRYVYEKNFEGPTLFAKAVSLAFLRTPAALAVRCRKDLVKRKLRALIETSSARPRRILSIAAGPAQEVYELLSEMEHVPGPVEVVLFDQDTAALSYAYGRLKRLVDTRWAGRVQVVYLHDSIKRLLKDPTLFTHFGNFDAIFACGLFDYLQFATAVVLCRNLCANLAPGGTAHIANMVPTNPSRWFMEHHLEWFLLYRTRAEMLEFAARAVPEMRIGIVEEETGVNPFLEIVRE